MRAAGVSRWLVAQNATPQRFMYIFGTIPMPTFYDRFVECAERWPQNVALEIQRRDGTESYTYSEARRARAPAPHELIWILFSRPGHNRLDPRMWRRTASLPFSIHLARLPTLRASC